MGMEDIFSTDEAIERFYESLEHRAYEQDRDSDDCVQHSSRIRSWQQNSIDYVSQKCGANQTEVGYAAYQEGITTVNAMMEDDEVQELEKLFELSFEIVGHRGSDKGTVDDSFSTIVSEGIDDPNKDHGELEEATTFYFKDSAYSMVKHDYQNTAGFGPWVHRAVMTIGFLESDTLPDTPMELSQETKERFKDAYKESRLDVESMLRDFIIENLFHWEKEGIHSDRLELIDDATDVMKTEHKDDVLRAVELLEENAEAIED